MRIKRGMTSHARHKKLLESTAGYRMTKHRLVKVAREAALHAGEYAYRGRKEKKRNFRQLWITRINGALNNLGLPYSQFMAGLKKANIALDRKMLAELAAFDFDTFKKVVEKARS